MMLGVGLEVKEEVVERDSLHTVPVGVARCEAVKEAVGEPLGEPETMGAAGEAEMGALLEAPGEGEGRGEAV